MIISSASPSAGQAGNSLGGRHASLKSLEPALTLSHCSSTDSNDKSPSISLTISKSFLAGMQSFPSFSTSTSSGSFSAVSMSVATIYEPFLPASRRKWLNMGIVFLFSAIF